MKFKIRINYFRVTGAEIIEDLKRTSKKLKKNRITMKEYSKYGKYNPGNVSRRFGTWNTALKHAGLCRLSRGEESVNSIIADINSISAKLNKSTFSFREYHQSGGKFTLTKICHRFGSWKNAVNSAGLRYEKYVKPDRVFLMENLKNAWIKLGRQPLCNEMKQPLSVCGKNEYAKFFGSWNKAVQAFSLYIKNSGFTVTINKPVNTFKYQKPKVLPVHKTSRTVNPKLRLFILERDCFTCRNCFRSPVTHKGLKLHVDHIQPWAEGGETYPENLETLCMRCNLKKGSRKVKKKAAFA